MRGRYKNRGEKRITTVSAAHKAEMRRIKSKDELDLLVLRLKMLGDSRMDVDRGCIASNITKSIPEFGLDSWRPNSAHRIRALRWVVKESVRLINIEKNPTVMFWLWRLLRECRGCRTCDFPEYEDTSIVPRLAIFILEKKPDVLVRSAVLYLMYKWNSYGSPEESKKVARICQGILVDFRARNGKLPDKDPRLPFFFVTDNEWEYVEVPTAIGILGQILRWRGGEGRLRDFIHEMVRSKEVIGILFDEVKSPMKIRWVNDADLCLALLLRHSRRADRTFLMQEYGEKLRKMMMGHAYLRIALHKDDVAEFFVNDYGLLKMMSGRITHERPNDEDTHLLAVRLLKCGLQMGDEILQRMLGLGFLASAGYMAWLRTDDDDDEADTFRAVLAAHPEWKQKFRQLTEVEEAISRTAQLGETIPARVSKRADYLLDDDVDDI